MSLDHRQRTRRDRCKEYLRKAGSYPAALALAAKDGFSQNTSVWIGALGEILKEDSKP